MNQNNNKNILCIFCFIIILLLFTFFVISSKSRKYEKYESKNIPLKIYQTWNTKNLSKPMKETVENLKKQNPEFEYFLFDDNDCIEFIDKYFHKDVLDAFNKLKPGAYKADLWRLCVLYINGGVYIDIKMSCINNFKLIEIIDKEHYVKDRSWTKGKIYNGFLVCKEGNPFLIDCINQIVTNTKSNYYGDVAIDPTGPGLLRYVILKNKNKYKLNLDMFHSEEGGFIKYKNKNIISTTYKEYYSVDNKPDTNYRTFYDKKDIYND